MQQLSTGQTAAHCGSSKWPTHSVQRSWVITYILSPTPWPSPTWLPFVSASLRVSKIASFGHSGRQAPQEIHSSVISNAMTLASFYTTIETHTVDKFTPSRPLCVARCDRHSSPPLFSKSTERHLLRRPRFPVLLGLWAQGIVTSYR